VGVTDAEFFLELDYLAQRRDGWSGQLAVQVLGAGRVLDLLWHSVGLLDRALAAGPAAAAEAPVRDPAPAVRGRE
jgi:hypothetical protein